MSQYILENRSWNFLLKTMAHPLKQNPSVPRLFPLDRWRRNDPRRSCPANLGPLRHCSWTITWITEVLRKQSCKSWFCSSSFFSSALICSCIFGCCRSVSVVSQTRGETDDMLGNSPCRPRPVSPAQWSAPANRGKVNRSGLIRTCKRFVKKTWCKTVLNDTLCLSALLGSVCEK